METRFAPCPESPNCVSSYADETDALHSIAALPLAASIDELVSVIESFPRTAIVERDGDYLHATFTSRIFRFVDDVEFLLDEEQGVTQVRSASRVGYGDMGANRSRVEAIRAKMNERGMK
jgi:uncharacterized protein (DUF1499 family)